MTPTTPPPTIASANVLQATRIFRDHWDTWCDLRLEDEVPPDQRAYAHRNAFVRKTIERLILCRDPSAGYARYVCPGCGFDRRVPFSCKTRFRPPSAPLRTGSCGKVRVDNWVNDIARDLYDVPHLHITLTIDDLLWPFFLAYRFLLKLLLKTAAQACPEHSRRIVRELVEELYPGLRIGVIYTLHPGHFTRSIATSLLLEFRPFLDLCDARLKPRLALGSPFVASCPAIIVNTTPHV